MNRFHPVHRDEPQRQDVHITADKVILEGRFEVPRDAWGIVLFVHGSGSSRHSRRNQQVAEALQADGIGTLLFDLLTAEEDRIDAVSAKLRFDVPLLAERLIASTRFVEDYAAEHLLRIGFFGASTGAAAALLAAADGGLPVAAVVSRGGRPDLAGGALARVCAPTRLIVGGADDTVLALNREAFEKLRCEKSLEIVPDATHLFEEPGALESVAALASDWFRQHMLGNEETRP